MCLLRALQERKFLRRIKKSSNFSVPTEIDAENREEEIGRYLKVVHLVAAINPTYGQTGSCEGSDVNHFLEHHVEQQGEKSKVRYSGI
jgi:hypothetical protein